MLLETTTSSGCPVGVGACFLKAKRLEKFNVRYIEGLLYRTPPFDVPSRSEENNKNNTIFRASYKVSMLLHVLSSTCRGEWNRGSLHSWPRSFSSRPNKCRLLVVYCAVYILLCIESLTLTSIRLRCCHFYEHIIYINSNTCSIKTLLFFQPNEPFFLFSHAIVESKLSLHVQVF